MYNMNEKMPLAHGIKAKAAEMISDLLVRQADQGLKYSAWFAASEAKIPVELLKEDAE